MADSQYNESKGNNYKVISFKESNLNDNKK